MNIACISASNVLHSGEQSTSLKVCRKIAEILADRRNNAEIIELRNFSLSPCIGCGKCYENNRCQRDQGFNQIYDKLLQADGVVFVSAHYAPIPAKLCILLEKAEEICFLHWWRDSTYQGELFGLPVAIVSHGGGSVGALESYRAMVNDTIANALNTIQCKVVPFNAAWKTGISLPVLRVEKGEGIFPMQEYDWTGIEAALEEYIQLFLKEISL